MNFYIKGLFITLVILFSSCASTLKIPPKPDYGTREDYPNLMEINHKLEVDNLIEMMEVNQKSFMKMKNMLKKITTELDCKEWGLVKIDLIVTKETKVDAPIIIRPLSSNCNEAALIALRYLKFDKPTRINGQPVNTSKVISFLINIGF